jgi:glycosyltransferase involved in cell wall biosynthesis
MSDQVAANELSLGGATVVELVPSIAPESFGLGYAALNLTAALERAGVNVYLSSVDEEKVARMACEEARFPQERLVRGSLIGPSRLRMALFLVRKLSSIPNNGKVIVHSHGMWTYTSYVAGKLRKRWECPHVQSPHGELEPYALTISPNKKALASLLYARRNLAEASCMWALSEQEKASIQAHGFTGQVAVIPNGVQRADLCTEVEVAEFKKRHDMALGSRVLLFLSRIARKKNLPLLLKAFAKNLKKQSDWVLLIAGSDERGHIHEVQALIQELEIEMSVRLIGQVSGREKACAFTSASVFVLPSHSEGLPIAVLEAMEYGKPLLLTDGWTFPVTTCTHFGWRVPAEDNAFESALLEAMNTPEARLMEMGRAARAVVREHFGWDKIAKQASSLYASLLADGHENRGQILSAICKP